MTHPEETAPASLAEAAASNCMPVGTIAWDNVKRETEKAIRLVLSASHLAKEGGEMVVVPYDDFHAAYQFVPRSKMSPDQCLKTRLRSLLRAEDLARVDEAEAIAVLPQHSPALAKGGDAVRVVWGIYLNDGRFMDIASDNQQTAIDMAGAHYEEGEYVVRALVPYTPTDGPASQTEGMGGDAETVEAAYREGHGDALLSSMDVDTAWDVSTAKADLAALTPPETAEAVSASWHADDIAVDRFAVAMKATLAKARAKGKGGWYDETACSRQYLSDELRRHALKPDPVDVANFAMFLHQRGETIAPATDDRERLVEALRRLANAEALAGVRGLVAGWNGEDLSEGPFERHPKTLGATLPKTNCGAVYELDEALNAARAALATEGSR